MSCSSKRNSDVGSCISTLVSSTNSVAGPVPRGRRERSGRVIDASVGSAAAIVLAATGAAAGSALSLVSSSTAGATGSAPGWGRPVRLADRDAAWASKSARLRKSARLAGGLGRGMGGSKRSGGGDPSGGCDRKPGRRWATRRSRAAARVAWRSAGLLDRLDGLQHFLDVAGDREAAPLGAQDAAAVDQEGAALDALDLLAVHDLVLDHAEHVAELFFGVGDQLERQLEVLLEAIVRRHVVARDAEQHGAGLDEILVVVAKLHRFGGAARRVVLRVEVEDDDLAGIGLWCELHPSRCKRFEFRDGFVECRRHEVLVAKPGRRQGVACNYRAWPARADLSPLSAS